MADYCYHGKWIGNPTVDENPAALYESIIAKPDDLFQYISYEYFEGSDTTVEYATSASSKIMSYVDTPNFGRCYTFKPTEQMIKKGIKQIILKLNLKSLQIFFHTNGIFETKMYSSGHRFFGDPKRKVELDLGTNHYFFDGRFLSSHK